MCRMSLRKMDHDPSSYSRVRSAGHAAVEIPARVVCWVMCEVWEAVDVPVGAALGLGDTVKVAETVGIWVGHA